MIRPLSGSDCGVARLDVCEVLEWSDETHRVVFSFARLGGGMNTHFACEPDSIRFVKQAIDEFCEWLFWAYQWCEMVFALTGKPSIGRLIQKCKFHFLRSTENYEIYVRLPT